MDKTCSCTLIKVLLLCLDLRTRLQGIADPYNSVQSWDMIVIYTEADNSSDVASSQANKVTWNTTASYMCVEVKSDIKIILNPFERVKLSCEGIGLFTFCVAAEPSERKGKVFPEFSCSLLSLALCLWWCHSVMKVYEPTLCVTHTQDYTLSLTLERFLF